MSKTIEVIDLVHTQKPVTRPGDWGSDEIYETVEEGALKAGDVVRLHSNDTKYYGRHMEVKFVKVQV